MDALRISAKDLGQLALADFCPRCFWVQRRAPKGVPYQIFPGIFSSIDSYTKKVVHQYFDVHGRAPDWLAPLAPISGYREPPHYSTFKVRHQETGILLTGALDAIFERPDGTLLFADYKTAKHTGNQDTLLPLYEVQLNGYAYIAAALGWEPVSALALIYTEPETDEAHAHPSRAGRATGFAMGFAAKIVPLKLEPTRIDPLLRRTRNIVLADAPPEGRTACKDCIKLAGIVGLLAGS
jgi:hypothetical protein